MEVSATDALSALCPDVRAHLLKYLLNNHRARLALGTSSFVRRGRPGYEVRSAAADVEPGLTGGLHLLCTADPLIAPL